MVIYTNKFLNDLQNASNYIIDTFNDHQSAGRLVNKALDSLDKEAEYISLIRRQTLLKVNNHIYYRLNIDKHVAIYTIRSNDLVAEFFCHSSQDIQRHITEHSNMS